MALATGHSIEAPPPEFSLLKLADRPPPGRPPAEDGDLVDAMEVIASRLGTTVWCMKIACLLLALLVVGLTLRLFGVG